MRVYVIEPLGKGGLIHYAYQLCRGLQQNNVDVTLVTSTDYELDDLSHDFTLQKFLHLWDPRETKSGSPIKRKAKRGLRGVRYIIEWLRLIRLLTKEAPDIVLFGEIRFGFEYYFLRFLTWRGLKLADVVHDVRTYTLNPDPSVIVNEDEAHLRQYNKIYQLFSALFVHDKSNRDLFLEIYDVPEKRVHQIVHATSELMLEVPQTLTPEQLQAELAIPKGDRVVLFFGTLTNYKGIEDAIRAFPMVIQAHPKARLVIAGYPAKDINVDYLQGIATELGLKEHISWFLDYVPNGWVATLIGMSDVVLLPYRAITQSGVLQVAYACAKPVVATRVGGLPDAVIDGETGALADPQNPESLAQALIRILGDEDKLVQMGINARERSQAHYSWKIVTAQMASVFESIAEETIAS